MCCVRYACLYKRIHPIFGLDDMVVLVKCFSHLEFVCFGRLEKHWQKSLESPWWTTKKYVSHLIVVPYSYKGVDFFLWRKIHAFLHLDLAWIVINSDTKKETTQVRTPCDSGESRWFKWCWQNIAAEGRATKVQVGLASSDWPRTRRPPGPADAIPSTQHVRWLKTTNTCN